MAISANIQKSKRRWVQVRKVLTIGKLSSKSVANYYKTVIQSVLLYGAETWVISQTMWQRLRTFHNGAARDISRKRIIVDEENGEYQYPDMETIFTDINLLPIEEYIRRRKETLIATVDREDYDDEVLTKCKDLKRSKRTKWWDKLE